MPGQPNTRWSAEAQGRAASYDDRWAEMAARGQNIHGEADFVTSLDLPRRSGGPSSVLDAGCGTGRVAVELARRGIDVVGADVDPSMLEKARAKAPDVPWVLGDLVDLDLGRRFDAVLLAGNVMIYVQPGTEGAVVARMAGHLEPGGALVAGFQVEDGRLDLATYDAHAEAAGLVLAERWATWDREPYRGGNYAVSVHRSRE
ncbi:MAG TPA: class I SAM-dependent methyltransferase [Acidimicrobiales bacterium]